jgi:hypothetical protein
MCFDCYCIPMQPTSDGRRKVNQPHGHETLEVYELERWTSFVEQGFNLNKGILSRRIFKTRVIKKSGDVNIPLVKQAMIHLLISNDHYTTRKNLADLFGQDASSVSRMKQVAETRARYRDDQFLTAVQKVTDITMDRFPEFFTRA